MHDSNARANISRRDKPCVEKDTWWSEDDGDFDYSCLHPPLVWPSSPPTPPQPTRPFQTRPSMSMRQLEFPQPPSEEPLAADVYGNVRTATPGCAHSPPLPETLLHPDGSADARIATFGSVYSRPPQQVLCHPPIIPPDAPPTSYPVTNCSLEDEAILGEAGGGDGDDDGDDAVVDPVRQALRIRLGALEERERCLNTVGRIFRAPRLRKTRSRRELEDPGEEAEMMCDETARLRRGRVAKKRRRRVRQEDTSESSTVVSEVDRGVAVRGPPMNTGCTMDWCEEQLQVALLQQEHRQQHCGL